MNDGPKRTKPNRSRCMFRKLTPPRLLFVPAGAVSTFVVVYLLAEATALAARRAYGDIAEPVEIMAHRVQWVALCGGAVLYGFARVMRSHPGLNLGYASWLWHTPWSASAPLPLGPVHLVARDAVPLLAVALLARFHARIDPVIPVAMFAFAYLLSLAQMLNITWQKPVAAAVVAWLPVMILLADRPVWALGAAAVIYPVALVGLRRSLATLPWIREHRPTGLPTRAQLAAVTLGWPLDRLAPKPAVPERPRAAGLVLALLAGWWLYAVLAKTDVGGSTGNEFLPVALKASLIPAAVLAIWRFARYVHGHAPPLGLAGRVATRRLIVPRYDYILLVPLAIVATGAAAPVALHAVGAPVDLTIAGALTLVLAVVMTAGPTVNHWRLTAAFRLVPAGTGADKKAQMKQGAV